MRGLLAMVGLPEMSTLSLFLVLVMIGLGAMLLGWIADLLLGENAFGTAFNTGFILIGAFGGAWLWQRFGVPTRFDPEAIRAVIAMGSGLVLLLALAVVRP